MFVIDPQAAQILDANQVASAFYGWSREELCSMRITDINVLSDAEARAEMERARQAERNYFEFRHRTRHGEVHGVAVHSLIATEAITNALTHAFSDTGGGAATGTLPQADLRVGPAESADKDGETGGDSNRGTVIEVTFTP